MQNGGALTSRSTCMVRILQTTNKQVRRYSHNLAPLNAALLHKTTRKGIGRVVSPKEILDGQTLTAK